MGTPLKPPASLVDRFRQAFGRWPQAFAEAPGRVNLIGEHTDYNGLPVLPMAIIRRVRVLAAARADREVHLRSTHPAFPARFFEIAPAIPPAAPGDWSNYYRAVMQEMVGWPGGEALCGAEVLVDGDIPPAAGLSSSAAFVVAGALAAAALAEIEVDRLWLAERLAAAERYVGTRSGGMDQAISLLGRRGHALRIDFFPLRTEPVPVPPDLRFVVAHSLVEAPKAGRARDEYNLRVQQCEEACRALCGALGRPVRRLGDIGAVSEVRGVLEALRRAGADEVVVRRVRHVLGEAGRVGEAVQALREGRAEDLGRLMDASHASCRDDYEVSCPELDRLAETAREAGALGARLTGAGFGGCVVALVRADSAAEVLSRLEERFYAPRGAPPRDERTWVFRPERGARGGRL